MSETFLTVSERHTKPNNTLVACYIIGDGAYPRTLQEHPDLVDIESQDIQLVIGTHLSLIEINIKLAWDSKNHQPRYRPFCARTRTRDTLLP